MVVVAVGACIFPIPFVVLVPRKLRLLRLLLVALAPPPLLRRRSSPTLKITTLTRMKMSHPPDLELLLTQRPTLPLSVCAPPLVCWSCLLPVYFLVVRSSFVLPYMFSSFAFSVANLCL